MTPNPYLQTVEVALSSAPLATVLIAIILAITVLWITRPMRRPPSPVVPSSSRAVVIDHEQG